MKPSLCARDQVSLEAGGRGVDSAALTSLASGWNPSPPPATTRVRRLSLLPPSLLFLFPLFFFFFKKRISPVLVQSSGHQDPSSGSTSCRLCKGWDKVFEALYMGSLWGELCRVAVGAGVLEEGASRALPHLPAPGLPLEVWLQSLG